MMTQPQVIWAGALFLLQISSSINLVSSSSEHYCTCGDTSADDSSSLNCVKRDAGGLTNTMLNTIYHSSKETCINFSKSTRNGLDTCSVNGSYSMNDYCTTASDGTKVCFIQSPNYSLGQCYPSLKYCAHSVTCPIGSVLYYYNSYVELPANFPHLFATEYYQCTDTIEVESYYHYFIRCGAANVPTFISHYGSLLVQFASSRNCQSRGYSMWANCVPLKIEDELREQYMQLNGFIESKKRQAVPITQVVEVNFSSTVQYRKGCVHIIENGAIVKTIRQIGFFYLYDEQGVFIQSFRRERNRAMHGYGILRISGYTAHYFEIGIPKQLIPNEKEKQLVNRLLEYVTPYFVKGKVYDGASTNETMPTPDSLSQSCHEVAGNFCLSCESAIPSKQAEADRRILEEANACKIKNSNQFVQSAANLVIETLTKRETY